MVGPWRYSTTPPGPKRRSRPRDCQATEAEPQHVPASKPDYQQHAWGYKAQAGVLDDQPSPPGKRASVSKAIGQGPQAIYPDGKRASPTSLWERARNA